MQLVITDTLVPQKSYLMFFNLNLLLCLHLLAISERLFNEMLGLLFRISNFSTKHRSHFREPHIYPLDRAWIFQLRLKSVLQSFNPHTYCESLVLLQCDLFLKLCLWFARRSLNAVSEQPMYSFSVSSVFTEALYTMAFC